MLDGMLFSFVCSWVYNNGVILCVASWGQSFLFPGTFQDSSVLL